MSRTGKIAAAGVAVAAAALVAYRLSLAARSDEERIRALIAEVAEGFNEASASSVTRALSDDFAEEASGAGRGDVHAFLARLFLSWRGRPDDERLRVEVDPEGLTVEIDAREPPSATISVTARFTARGGGGRTAVVLFEGSLVKVKGAWRIHRASRQVKEGRWPF